MSIFLKFTLRPGLVFLYLSEIQILKKNSPLKSEPEKELSSYSLPATDLKICFTLFGRVAGRVVGTKNYFPLPTVGFLLCTNYPAWQRVKNFLRLVPAVKKKKARCLNLEIRKTILGNFQSLGEILEFIVLPFVKLHHIGHIFFFFNPSQPHSLQILRIPT